MHTPTLDIDLTAIAANYRILKARHAKGSLACVVKADAYGLGMREVSNILWNEGCREFFVATLAEAIALRGVLGDASIGVFSGVLAGEEKEYAQFRLLPVVNDLRFAQDAGFKLQDPAIIHVDTGMTRLGLSLPDLETLASHIPHPKNILLMSHLACAGNPHHPKNAEQLQRFRAARALFPGAKASLANSAGLFLSPDFHFDMARPGCALYGINPLQGANPMRAVATLSAPILQIRELDRDETIGYDATYTAKKGGRIAIAGMGYADGWPRSLSNKGCATIGGHKVPIAGIVSMDMIALDVSAIPQVQTHMRAEFINAEHSVDDVARECGTIGYEIFTRIGNRVQRRYRA